MEGRNKSVKNSRITLVVIDSVSMFVVPKRTTLPPVESHVYSSTSILTVSLLSIERWEIQAQRPEGSCVAPGTPESVAYVASRVLVLPAMFIVTDC